MTHGTVDIQALISSARQSLSGGDRIPAHPGVAGVAGGEVAPLAGKILANRSAAALVQSESLWRTKALAALSQLSSLQQRTSAAELKVTELQVELDQQSLTCRALDEDNSNVRATLAEVQDERDRLMLEVRLRRAKVGEVEAGAVASTRDDTRTESLTKELSDLKKLHRALLIDHEETKMENEALLQKQEGLLEHVSALQASVSRLQDENDYFSLFKEEDVLAQEDDLAAVFGAMGVGAGPDGGQQASGTLSGDEQDLRKQLADTEAELLALHETLDEERLRSSGLHAQCVKQSEELGELRERVNETRRVEQTLAALKEVHADTLEKVVTLQLELERVRDERGMGAGGDGRPEGRGRILAEDDDVFSHASDGNSWLTL